MELARHADDVVATTLVGREDGALDVEVAVCDVVEHLVDSGAVLWHEVLVVPAASAALLAYHHAAGLLNDVEELPVGHGHWRAGVEDALGSLGCSANTLCHALLALVGHLVDCAGQTRRVIHKGSLHGKQGVQTGDGRGIRRASGREALQGTALVVGKLD